MLRFISLAILLLIGLYRPLAAASHDDTRYQLGRGYAVGDTGWRLGGYASTKFTLPRQTPWSFEVNDLSLFLTWDNASRLRFFSELEAGDALTASAHQWPGTKNTSFEFERFYLDGLINNQLSVRVGKFLTPVGQWNVIHAAPLVWTSFRPVATENLFSTHVSGLMLHGSTPVAGHQLEYALYGDLSVSIDPHLSDNAFKNAVGARLRYPFSDSLQLGISYANFVLQDLPDYRNSLAGLDLGWFHERFEFNSEVVYRSPDLTHKTGYWQGYTQGVRHLSLHWFAIGRYEFFEQAHERVGQVGLLGIAYRPLSPLILKLEYRLGVHNETLAPDGLATSIAILF